MDVNPSSELNTKNEMAEPKETAEQHGRGANPTTQLDTKNSMTEPKGTKDKHGMDASPTNQLDPHECDDRAEGAN